MTETLELEPEVESLLEKRAKADGCNVPDYVKKLIKKEVKARRASQTRPNFTPQEYLAIERASQQRNEYFNGEIFAMGGASEKHNLIVGNVFTSLHAQMRSKPCKAYSSDMRVKISQTGLYPYPDVVAVCGEARFDDEQQDTLLNPQVIIEVLSKSTEAYDRGEKFPSYRKLASLLEYVLIFQDKHCIEHYARQPDKQWLMYEISPPQESVELPSIQCTPLMANAYDKL